MAQLPGSCGLAGPVWAQLPGTCCDQGRAGSAAGNTRNVVTGPQSVRRSRRADTVRVVPSGVRAAERVRPAEPGVLAAVRARRPGRDAGRGTGAAAYGGARGTGCELDPPARPARRRIRTGVGRDDVDLSVEPAGPGSRGGAGSAGRRTARARGCVRAAGPGRSGPRRRLGLELRGARP